MKCKKLLLTLPLLTLISLASCQANSVPINDEQAQQENDPLVDEYFAYLANGGKLSYEEWHALIKGEKGSDGKSAYELAISSGFFKGTEAQWNEYLQGAEGVDANKEIMFTYLDNDKNVIIVYKDTTTINLGSFYNSFGMYIDMESDPLSPSLHVNPVYVRGHVFIPSLQGFTKVPESLFDGAYNLTSIYIADGITEIGENAFRDCTGLESIYIPKSVTKINRGAFKNCSRLSMVYYGGTLVELRNITYSNHFSVPTNITGQVCLQRDDGNIAYQTKKYYLTSVSKINVDRDNIIDIWVPSGMGHFYENIIDDYLSVHPSFAYSVDVEECDVGSAASYMSSDNTECGDIIALADDGIGKLSQLSYIYPITNNTAESTALLNQISSDNNSTYIAAVTNQYGEDTSSSYVFAAPYSSYALFLYYDTRYVTEEEANSFEGLITAAARYDSEHSVTNTKAVTVTGSDGYNFSLPILSRNITNGNTSSLRLYERGENKDSKQVRYDSYLQTNEQVAIMRHMQSLYQNPNGLLLESDSPWSYNIAQHKALSFIGASWHYNTLLDAVGYGNFACKPIPTYTLTNEDVAGIEAVTIPNDEYLPVEMRNTVDPAPVAGTVMRGGTFTDCYAFALNSAYIDNLNRYKACCSLISLLSSVETQNAALIEKNVIPSYQGAETYMDVVETSTDAINDGVYQMAKAQCAMSNHGIASPFTNGTLNTFYYAKGAPDYYLQCVKNTYGDYNNVNNVRQALYRVEYIWKHGVSPNTYPASFPFETATTR